MDVFAERLAARPPETSPAAPPAGQGGAPASPDPATAIDQMQQYRAVVEQLPGWRRIGDILVELGFATPEQIEQGLNAQRGVALRQRRPVGLLDTLQEMGILTSVQAQHALNHQISHCYLPALAGALTERDKAIGELRATYQTSLQTIARYAEEAQLLNRELEDLRSQVKDLHARLGGRR